MKTNLFCSAIICAVIVPASFMFGQGPVQNVNPQRHVHLAAAQRSISEAYQQIEQSQASYHDRVGGHEQKAEDLLRQAAQELTEAAQYADQHYSNNHAHGH